MDLKLPSVAKSVYVNCTKCAVDRYHRVIAHTSSTSAKVECEVCKKKRSYSIETAKPKTASKTSSALKSKSSGRGGLRQTHVQKYDSLKTQLEAVDAVAYNIRSKFANKQVIRHPSFGLGLVLNALDDRIEVMFETEVKNLVHNRQ